MNNPFTPSTKYPPVCYDADPAKYHSLGKAFGRGKPEFVMSRSELVRFNRNPWKWIHGAQTEETTEMEWGSLIDCLALTPDRFSECYEVVPETYTTTGMKCPVCHSVTDAKKCAKCKVDRVQVSVENPWNFQSTHCEEWREKVRAAGKTPVKRSMLTAAKEAVFRLTEDEFIKRLFDASKKQVQIVVEYRDKLTDITVQVKMLLDLLPDPSDSEFGRMLADLKSTNNAEIAAWEKHIYSYNLHTQAGLYLDGTNAALGTSYDGFLHAVQEQDAPYATARRMLADEFIQMGRETYQSALKRYCACLASGRWPGFDDEDNQPGNPILDGWRLVNPSAWMI
jgi:hypothetical protein